MGAPQPPQPPQQPLPSFQAVQSAVRPTRQPAFLAALRNNRTRSLEIFILLVIVVAVIALIPALSGPAGRLITAHFGTAIGIYSGSDVRVLGVKVGAVESVKPVGAQVRTVLRVDDDVDVPAGARAVVIAPNLVSDRYVQLLPAYGGGPKLAAGADIDVSRTATPLELDQLYDSIRKFSGDLGPDGVNARGALSSFIRTGAANFQGNGKLLNNTIADLGRLSQTLSDSSDDLYGTFANLNRFSVMLRANDSRVRLAERQLADVSGFLAADRGELTAGLREMAIALQKLKDLIDDNQVLLRKNVSKLASITQTLVDRRASLAESLDTLPLLAGNVLNAYDPSTRSLMSRGNLLEITKAFGSTSQPGVDPAAADTRPACAAAAVMLRGQCDRVSVDGLLAVPPAERASVPPLPLPPAGPVYGGTSASSGGASASSGGANPASDGKGGQAREGGR